MNSFLIDTNCLISFTTTRDIKQNKIITEYFESASRLNLELIIISNVITEFVYTLDSVYQIDKRRIIKLIEDLLNNPGIKYHDGYYPHEIVEIWPSKIKDYGDAVIASAAKMLETSVLTFDKKFSRQLKASKIVHKLLA